MRFGARSPNRQIKCIANISTFTVIEYYNNKKNWRAREGHAGGGRETIIQFVVALYNYIPRRAQVHSLRNRYASVALPDPTLKGYIISMVQATPDYVLYRVALTCAHHVSSIHSKKTHVSLKFSFTNCHRKRQFRFHVNFLSKVCDNSSAVFVLLET